jgi:hypothetical protein
MSTAANWFETIELFRALLDEATDKARTDAATGFVKSMHEKATAHGLGTYLSQKQLSWLCTIAGVMTPPERARANYDRDRKQARRLSR